MKRVVAAVALAMILAGCSVLPAQDPSPSVMVYRWIDVPAPMRWHWWTSVGESSR